MRGRLLILTYHRVLAEPDALMPGHAHAAGFARQMQTLARGFNVLPLADAAARLRTGSLPARAVSITFDDGYADNAEIAAPILARHGLTASFFVATGFLDGGRMWNDTLIEVLRAASGELDLTRLGLGRFALHDLAARRQAIDTLISRLKYLPVAERLAHVEAVAQVAGARLPGDLMMRSAQVRELHDAGMEIGAHTVSHPILSALAPADAETEITACRDRLQELIGAPVRSFAYPNGRPGVDYTAEHVAAVRRAGFQLAVSTAWGAAGAGHDAFELPRLGFATTSRALFALKVLRAYGELAAVAGPTAGRLAY